MVENRNLSVGVFVSVAIAILIVFTVWITGKRGAEPMTRYSVLIEHDVSGLMLGGPVFFLGVSVGEVMSLDIVPGDPVGVRVDIEVLEATPVNSGTWATLAAQGITGVSVINLSNDPGQHQPIPLTPGQDHPMIPFRDSGFSAILASAPAILDQIQSLLDKAGNLLDEQNQLAISNTLANLDSMTHALAAPESGLADLPGSVNQTLGEIQATVVDVRALLSESGPDLQAGLANVEAATQNLADITGSLTDWLDRNEAEMEQFVGEGLGQVPALISDIRDAVREMEKLLADIRREPSGLIYQTADGAVPVEEE